MQHAFENKPADIQHSMRTGNTVHLRAAQRRSVEARKRNAEARKEMEELLGLIEAEEKIAREREIIKTIAERGGDPED